MFVLQANIESVNDEIFPSISNVSDQHFTPSYAACLYNLTIFKTFTNIIHKH